jgi:Ca2+-transporting ATPase
MDSNQNWYNKIISDVEKAFDTNAETGLSSQGVINKREKYGYNELKEAKKKSLFVKFLEQFQDFMVIVLIIAAIISGIVGMQNGEGFTDTIIIMVVIICNAIIGVVQENKAEKALDALKKLSSHSAKTIRDGKLQVLQSRELVPGDVVVLETGDYIPADLRIVEAINLKTQEASLTGESVPVEKDTEAISNK